MPVTRLLRHALLTGAVALVLGAAVPPAGSVALPSPAVGGRATPAAAPEMALAASVTPRSARMAPGTFPTGRTAGVPRGWTPRRSVEGTVTISKPGAVVKDLRITNGDLVIDAPNVRVSRVEVIGGAINNYAGGTCNSGLVVRATTIRRAPGQVTEGDDPALGAGGYTARRVEIIGLPEGFRVGGGDDCGPVKIIRSLARVTAPDVCGDWHGDALQGYGGAALTIRDSVLILSERPDCSGTAPFFYPSDQGNTSVDIDGLVVSGGGYPFRLGEPGRVQGLSVVKGSWYYGPIAVECSALSTWNADVVRLVKGQPVRIRKQPCGTQDGS